MTTWFYLVLAFASLFSFYRKTQFTTRRGSSVFLYALRLSVATGLVVLIQNLCCFFVWDVSGIREGELATLFLWTILVDWAVNGFRRKEKISEEAKLIVTRFSLALFAFSYWILQEQTLSNSWTPLMMGLALPFATGFFEWILSGLNDRLRLSDLPHRVQGAPLVFWLSMFLALAVYRSGAFQ